MSRLIKIDHLDSCPPTLELNVGDLLMFAGTGGHVHTGADLVQFLGPFHPGALKQDGTVVSAMGTPNTVMFVARGPGKSTIDVVTGDPWKKFQTTAVTLIINT